MPPVASRIPFSIQHPFRPQRPATDKIIFLSMEGCVTEEEYFERVREIFSDLQNRIQFISVVEDAVNTHYKYRTTDQNALLSKVRPKQLVERIDQFKREKADIFQFDTYPEDEFWIVTDVDQNWDLWLAEWEQAVSMCAEKGYQYAVSNPFFEVWLLLHHDEATDEDKAFAVTELHSYEKTDHYRQRLAELGFPLHGNNQKHIDKAHYNAENIKAAMERARALHRNEKDLAPKYLSSTVYILMDKIYHFKT